MKVYSIFHLNLMFSSIPESERGQVIQKCYWPLLELCKKNFKIGIELTGLTLEIINDLDKNWIKEFKRLLNLNKVELIGSGYSQLIGPLVPSVVNRWNQRLGIIVYKKILNKAPKIALVNEMAYSSGIIEHYKNSGYETLIMEYNNCIKYNPSWKLKPSEIINQQNQSIKIIWADSISFQQFQRFAHGELSYENYKDFLIKYSKNYINTFPVYTSDAEVFNYRPGRFKNESVLKNNHEWKSIEKLYSKLKSDLKWDFILPSKVSDCIENKFVSGLETVEQPIIVKKQSKYNINRWALSGRDDLMLNTYCHNILNQIIDSNNELKWKQLCFYWSSDFRTHITNERWNSLILEINKNYNFKLFNKFKISHTKNEEPRIKTINNGTISLDIDSKKGCSLKSLTFFTKYKKPVIGTIQHGFFKDIEYAFDWFSGNGLIDRLGFSKITDLGKASINVKNNEILTELKDRGVTFNSSIILKNDNLILSKQIKLESKKNELIRPYHFTFIPNSWDKKSLYYATHNGGSELEIFNLKTSFNHSKNLSYQISSVNGLGNTNGLFIIGDKFKKVIFKTNLLKSALIPKVIFKNIDNSYLLRVIFSAQEIDDNFKPNDNEQIIDTEISISLELSSVCNE